MTTIGPWYRNLKSKLAATGLAVWTGMDADIRAGRMGRDLGMAGNCG